MQIDSDANPALLENKARRIIEVNQNISEYALKQKLLQNSIATGIIDQVLHSTPEQEQAKALIVIQKRFSLVKGKTERERDYKMINYLARKGYKSGDARAALDVYRDNT